MYSYKSKRGVNCNSYPISWTEVGVDFLEILARAVLTSLEVYIILPAVSGFILVWESGIKRRSPHLALQFNFFTVLSPLNKM